MTPRQDADEPAVPPPLASRSDGVARLPVLSMMCGGVQVANGRQTRELARRSAAVAAAFAARQCQRRAWRRRHRSPGENRMPVCTRASGVSEHMFWQPSMRSPASRPSPLNPDQACIPVPRAPSLSSRSSAAARCHSIRCSVLLQTTWARRSLLAGRKGPKPTAKRVAKPKAARCSKASDCASHVCRKKARTCCLGDYHTGLSSRAVHHPNLTASSSIGQESDAIVSTAAHSRDADRSCCAAPAGLRRRHVLRRRAERQGDGRRLRRLLPGLQEAHCGADAIDGGRPWCPVGACIPSFGVRRGLRLWAPSSTGNVGSRLTKRKGYCSRTADAVAGARPVGERGQPRADPTALHFIWVDAC